MDPAKDAFGKQLLAHLHDGNLFEIVERDDGFIGVADLTRYFAAYGAWPEIEQRAITLAKGKVLDVGCGAGRVALYLQERGISVTSIDNSAGAIDVCKELGVKDAHVIALADVEQLDEKYDTVCMFGNNLGLFENPARLKELLAKLSNITTSDAIILAGSADVLQTDNPVHLAYHEKNRKEGKLPGQLQLRIRYQTSCSDWFEYLMISKEELAVLLEGTGWMIKETIDSDDKGYVAVIGRE